MVIREAETKSAPLTGKQLQALGGLLQMVFKEIRILGWEGKSEQAADLADAVCQLPLRMFSRDFAWEHYERSLNDYQQRYPDRNGPDYLAFLKRIRQNEAV